MKKYNIGLDIGTTSVGWAVVECDTQKIIRKGTGKDRRALWGARLFDPASTAQKRRSFRSTRRRYDRRRERIKLLQEEFKDEINKIDSKFYKKLAESKYHKKDKINKTIFLSEEETKKVKEYNKKYKTIYHLRNRLITDSSKEDIRLVYLAIHHIIKYRGNFLYSGDDFNVKELNISKKIEGVFDAFYNFAPSLNIEENYSDILDYEQLEEIMLNTSKNDVKVELMKIMSDISDNKSFALEFAQAVIGNKANIEKLLMLEGDNKLKISFSGTDYEDKYDELESLLGEKIEIIAALKELYSALFLKKIFKGSNHTSLSRLMEERYDIHKNDLRFLKKLFYNHRNLYNQLLKSKKTACLYDLYIHNKKSYEDFIKELDKLISKLPIKEVDKNLLEEYQNVVKKRMDAGEFLPRITDPENGKYPFQLNREELIQIIENQGKYYPFLQEKINGKYRLVKLLEFKIPYYVGPLVSEGASRFAWMERKIDHVKITPYNFDEVVDKDLTAEKFIMRMISHCTYLLKEYALPNDSILYCKYKVLNELKQIKVNGTKLTLDQQHDIFNHLFLKTNGTITAKKFKQYLYTLNDFSMYGTNISVTGYSSDEKFANNMQPYIDFFGENGIFLDTEYAEPEAEEVIKWITIFEDKDILEKKIREKYTDLPEANIKKILSKKYSGWGNLSEKLLTELTVKEKETGIAKNIMTLMYETEKNFMQIINDEEYNFQDLIKEHNMLKEDTKLRYKLLEDLATFPATKKGIYQSLKVIQEIIDYMGNSPENIIIEMARQDDPKKQRTVDRKKYLLNIYEEKKNEIEDFQSIHSKLKALEKVDSQKLLLYFLQEGKCLYSGKPLNIEDLDSYEIDHILPRTLIKDDSIDNKALVYRECNQIKAASFVVPKMYRNYAMIRFWEHLKKCGLISATKFYRLTRNEYSDEDIQGFINRQLVETRQITKHVANIISNLYKDTHVIYLKANLSRNYREKFEVFKFREINDYHHAHDAYLAAVLGEYKEKYMKNKVNFEMICELNKRLRELKNYKDLKYGFVINSLDNAASDITIQISNNFIDQKTGEVLFDAEKFNNTVVNNLYRNDILISRKTEIRSGQFFKQSILPKKKGTVCLKKNMPTEMYGGYTNVMPGYMMLVKYKKGKMKMIGIPLEIIAKSENDENVKLDFIKNQLKLKESDELIILKDKIPFESLLNYKGQNVYIKGYSIADKNSEISNAYQLKIPKEKLNKWKYILNEILNDKKELQQGVERSLTEEIIKKDLIEIIRFLLKQKENFPLFQNSISRIEFKLDLNIMDKKQLSKVIKELLKIYRCDSTFGDLKEFDLNGKIGKITRTVITQGALIFTSVTGLKKEVYEF